MENEVIQSEDGINKLEFKLKITEIVKRKMYLGDVTIIRAGDGIELQFVCVYDMDVTISSEQYTIQDTAISATTTGRI